MLSVSGDSVPPVSAEKLPSVPPVPHRAGSPWTVEATEVLLDGVHRGLDPDEMAASLQHKTSAVLARCKKMLTPEFEVRAPRTPISCCDTRSWSTPRSTPRTTSTAPPAGSGLTSGTALWPTLGPRTGRSPSWRPRSRNPSYRSPTASSGWAWPSTASR